MVNKGIKFKKYGFHREMIERLRKLIQIQESGNKKRKTQIDLLQKAILKLGA